MRELVAEYRYGDGDALYYAGREGSSDGQPVCKVVYGVTNNYHDDQWSELWKDDAKLCMASPTIIIMTRGVNSEKMTSNCRQYCTMNFQINKTKFKVDNSTYVDIEYTTTCGSYTHFRFAIDSIETKRRRSDPVLWQKPLHEQKCQKGKVTTQTTPRKSSIKQQLRTDLGRSVGVTRATQLVWLTLFTDPPPHSPQ